MSESKVTIVIPNYNGMKYLPDCLESIRKQTCSAEIIVVDNGSADGSAEYIRDNYPEIMLICLPDNTGFANAVNVGIKEVMTDYVFLLNNDTVLDENAVRALLSSIERSRKIFSVSARMLSLKDPHRIDDSGDLYCALGWAFSPGRDRKDTDIRYRKRAYITSACGGAALYRMSALKKTGYFDDVHFCYLEDVDLGYRARIFGYRNVYEPAATVYHAGSATSGSRHNAFKVRLTSANNIYFLYKNMPLLQLFINLPLIIAGTVIKQVYFARKGLGFAFFRGLFDGFGKILANPDRKISFSPRHLENYILLQLELWYNCIRRITG